MWSLSDQISKICPKTTRFEEFPFQLSHIEYLVRLFTNPILNLKVLRERRWRDGKMGIWSWNRGGSLTRQICLISIIWNLDEQHYIPSVRKKYSGIFSQITLKQHPGLRLCAEHVPDSVYLTNLIFCSQFPFVWWSSKIIRITRIWEWYWGTPLSWLVIGTMMPGTELIDKARKDKFDKLEMDKGHEFNDQRPFRPFSRNIHNCFTWVMFWNAQVW